MPGCLLDENVRIFLDDIFKVFKVGELGSGKKPFILSEQFTIASLFYDSPLEAWFNADKVFEKKIKGIVKLLGDDPSLLVQEIRNLIVELGKRWKSPNSVETIMLIERFARNFEILLNEEPDKDELTKLYGDMLRQSKPGRDIVLATLPSMRSAMQDAISALFGPPPLPVRPDASEKLSIRGGPKSRRMERMLEEEQPLITADDVLDKLEWSVDSHMRAMSGIDDCYVSQLATRYNPDIKIESDEMIAIRLAIRYHLHLGGFEKDDHDKLTEKGFNDMKMKLDGIDFSQPVEVAILPVGSQVDSMQAAGVITGVLRQGQFYAIPKPFTFGVDKKDLADSFPESDKRDEQMRYEQSLYLARLQYLVGLADERGISAYTMQGQDSVEAVNEMIDKVLKQQGGRMLATVRMAQLASLQTAALDKCEFYLSAITSRKFMVPKQLTEFSVVRAIPVLRSHAKSITDNWSAVDAVADAKGGGVQLWAGTLAWTSIKSNLELRAMALFQGDLRLINLQEYTDASNYLMLLRERILFDRMNLQRLLRADRLDEERCQKTIESIKARVAYLHKLKYAIDEAMKKIPHEELKSHKILDLENMIDIIIEKAEREVLDEKQYKEKKQRVAAAIKEQARRARGLTDDALSERSKLLEQGIEIYNKLLRSTDGEERRYLKQQLHEIGLLNHDIDYTDARQIDIVIMKLRLEQAELKGESVYVKHFKTEIFKTETEIMKSRMEKLSKQAGAESTSGEDRNRLNELIEALKTKIEARNFALTFVSTQTAAIPGPDQSCEAVERTEVLDFVSDSDESFGPVSLCGSGSPVTLLYRRDGASDPAPDDPFAVPDPVFKKPRS